MRFGEAVGRAVVSQASAERIGELKRYHLDLPSARLDALEVVTAGESPRILTWDKVVGFGADAIVVASPESLRGPEGEEELRFVAGDLDMEGKRVLTEDGDLLGHVRDVEFDDETGHVVRLELDRASVPVSRFMANGPYALIVPA